MVRWYDVMVRMWCDDVMLWCACGAMTSCCGAYPFVAPVYPLHCTIFFCYQNCFLLSKLFFCYQNFFLLPKSGAVHEVHWYIATKKWYTSAVHLVHCYQKVVHLSSTLGTLPPNCICSTLMLYHSTSQNVLVALLCCTIVLPEMYLLHSCRPTVLGDRPQCTQQTAP